MTTERMNVHQALAELKTMDKRIEAAICGTEWVITNKHSNTLIDGLKVEDWKNNVKAKYDKVQDLIRRRDAIKRAVVNSNAVTKIMVAGVEYTVAEAIDRKNHGIGYMKTLVRRLAHDQTQAKLVADRENGSRLDDRVEAFVRSQVGNTDTKGMTEEIKKRREEFIAAQTTDVLDPINTRLMIEQINEELYAFETQVDAALSTSNAMTYLEISY